MEKIWRRQWRKYTKPFREIKRVIAQWFETEYWYRHYKPAFWFDDEANKYIEETKPYLGCNPLIDTWNGENSIFNIVIRKIEHMFYMLKKYGNERNWYVDSFYFTEQGATEEDRKWAMKKFFSSIEKDEWPNVSKDGEYTYIWFTNKDVVIEDSDSGLRHYYLKFRTPDKFDVVYMDDYDAGISKTFSELHFEDGKVKSTPSHIYKHKEEVELWVNADWYDIEKWAKDLLEIDLTKTLIEGCQTFDITPEDYVQLSDFIKSKTRGNRVKCKQLLELRRKIKEFNSLDDCDSKYNVSKWPEYNNNLPGEEKKKLWEKAHKLYMLDRKILLRDIADFIAEYGMQWWD